MIAASLAVWVVTAALGANLLFRGGAFRGGPSGRSARRRAVLTIHVLCAASGLAVGLWFFFVPTFALGAVAILLLLTRRRTGC